MKENFCRKDIFRLSEYFDFPKNEVWDLIRKGRPIIIGKKYLFVKFNDGDLDIGLDSYQDDFGYGIISILNITTGHKEKYKYAFFGVHGDYNDKFNVSIMNIMTMYEFTTGKSASEILLQRQNKIH